MTDYTVDPDDEYPDINSYIDEHNFSTASFIENDLLTSLVSFCLIIFSPMLVWEQLDHKLMFIWQGLMIAILAIRWLCGFSFANAATTGSPKSHWEAVIITLILVEGLGWGISGAFLFPVDSLLIMSVVALLLIGVGGVNSVFYSSNILVAVPFLVCTTLPYITRLFSIGGNNESLIASTLGLLSIMFYFAIFRLNNTLNTAFEVDTEDETTIINLEEDNLLLKKNIRQEKNKFKKIKDQLTTITSKSQETETTLTKLSEDLYQLAGTSLNVVNELGLLRETKLTKKQKQFLSSAHENAQELSERLDQINIGDAEFKPITHIAKDEKKALANRRSILVVNDQKNESAILENCVQEAGCDAILVDNIPSAITTLCDAEANNNFFDIIICTINMPEIDGVGFAECLREDLTFKNIKFILLGSCENNDQERLNTLNIDQLIERPIDKERLVSTINESIKRLSKKLPDSVQSLIDDSLEISTLPDHNEKLPVVYNPVIDTYVIEGLRSIATTNFPLILNNYLEEIPRLLEQARSAQDARKYSELKVVAEDLASRSIHIGALGLVEHFSAMKEAVDEKRYTAIPNLFHSVSAEFIQVESTLMAMLVGGKLIQNDHRH